MDNATQQTMTGFRVSLPLKNTNVDDGTGYTMIRFPSWHFYLPKTNKAKCRCVECVGQIEKGEGIWQKERGGKRGFTCRRCVDYLIKKYAPRGFKEDMFLNLYPAHFDEPIHTVEQVIAAIVPAASLVPKDN